MKASISTRSKSAKKFAKQADMSAIAQTERDLKDAVLTVSIFANLFILSVWVALQVTSKYDDALAAFFIQR